MAFTLTKAADGDEVWGKHRLEHVQLKPSVSDYATGGYSILGIGGTTESTGNIGIDKVAYVIPIGGEGGYKPTWNPTTSKLQIYEDSTTVGPMIEVPANTDLSAYTFNLLVAGY